MTFTDMKQPIDTNNLSLGFALSYHSISNYYPFGMQMPGMSWTDGDGYRYGFQGQEQDNEIYGVGNNYDFGARSMDVRLGKWFSLDPLASKYSFLSDYAFVANSPIMFVDPDGRDILIGFQGGFNSIDGAAKIQPEDASSTGVLISALADLADQKGIDLKTSVYQNGFNTSDAVELAYEFIIKNYVQGENILIYGYSWGADGAIELSKRLKDELDVDMLITVDGADGPLTGYTVNRNITDNVKRNLNYYQTEFSILGSRGDPNVLEDGNNKTLLVNKNLDNINNLDHGNIDDATLNFSTYILLKVMDRSDRSAVPDITIPDEDIEGSSRSSSEGSSSSIQSPSGSSFNNSTSGSTGSSGSSQGSSKSK